MQRTVDERPTDGGCGAVGGVRPETQAYSSTLWSRLWQTCFGIAPSGVASLPAFRVDRYSAWMHWALHSV